MIISKITGFGKQTIEALKYAIASLRSDLTSLTGRVSAIESGVWTSVTVTAEGDESHLDVALPDSTTEVIVQLYTAQGITSSAVAFMCNNVTIRNAANVINSASNRETSIHMWKLNLTATGFNVGFAYSGPGASGGQSVTYAYTSREVTKWGTFSAVISNELVTYTEGDKIVVFYK